MSTINAPLPINAVLGSSHDFAARITAKAQENAGDNKVHITAAVEAQRLQRSGDTVDEIAALLGANADTIDQYLELAASTTATAPTAPSVQAAPAAALTPLPQVPSEQPKVAAATSAAS